MNNVIIHLPLPLFLEYLNADLKRETKENVESKFIDVIDRLDKVVGMPSIYPFISDSCNVIRAVKQKLFELKKVKFFYGCSAHCLINLPMGKSTLSSISKMEKPALFVSKCIKNIGLFSIIFEILCEENEGTVYSMKFFIIFAFTLNVRQPHANHTS